MSVTPAPTVARLRVRVRVRGTVQGVGFRPFVFRLAHEEGLAGHVLNDEQGVVLEAEGAPGAVDRFLERLGDDAPPLAAIEAVERRELAPTGETGFRIVASARAGAADALVAPDCATCPDCLRELTDPADRRHRYPFINCTNCGPRFTIVVDVPYDRPLTTMAPFVMCPACRREYEDPLDRRFHAQPNACPQCGPRLRLLDGAGAPVAPDAGLDVVAGAAARLSAGAIVAVKGVGGFHLACNAADERAVARLRARKHREARPFALMVTDADRARAYVELDAEAVAVLQAPARPIVLAPRVSGAPVAGAVAPGLPELGVMLPYTPLHHLLLADAASRRVTALVMTSGNLSDEPIAYRDDDGRARLRDLADLFLVHDREIETRTDDSVVRVVTAAGRRRGLMLRRSRGFVPRALTLPVPAPRPLLACGAEQKSTITVARGEHAWVSHHIGDLEHFATWEAFREGVAHFERLFAVAPEIVACDLHPDYASTRYAHDRADAGDAGLLGVQHHHAHLAACLAEHGRTGPAVGAIFDGTGYGPDGTVWGGELLVGGLMSWTRAGWLWPVRMPGAAAAIRQPWRMAAAWLAEACGEAVPVPRRLARIIDPGRWAAMAAVGADSAVSPLTSSMGRLFDAVGALCGLCPVQAAYEGQAAVMLESAAWAARDGGGAGLEIPVTQPSATGGAAGDGGLILDPRPAVRRIWERLEAGEDPARVAAGFHAAVAAASVSALTAVAAGQGLQTAVLSGGVFQNRLLLETVAADAAAAGLEVLVPELLPPNDGGISFGQAAVAAAREA